MPITLRSRSQGAVTLQDADMPNLLPFGGKQAGGEDVRSDGTRVLQITGVSLANIDLSGTLRHGDTASPLAKADALGAMRDRGEQVELTWTGMTASRRWFGRILDFVPTIARNEEVDYTLSFFRELSGALSIAAAGATPTDPPAVRDRLGAARTAGTDAAIRAAQARLDAIGRGR